jgi:hypothetical protein
MAQRRKNDFLAEQAVFHVESSVQANTRASGTITCDTNANGADGNTVTIGDGIQAAKVYEYDKSANGVTAGNISWAAGTTAASNATALAALIATNQPSLSVVDNLAGVLTITHKIAGVHGNVTITKSGNVVSAVTGMTGGVTNANGVAATTTQKFTRVPRILRVDTVEYYNPTGFTQDTTNYWTITLKNGSAVVASWSTRTADQGTITGGTGVTLVNSATDANLVFAAGDTMSLVMTPTGSPAVLPPGRMTVHGHYVS